MYKVIREFYDLQDKTEGRFYFYKVGDTYPREGVEPTSERIAYLASAENMIGTPVIKEIVDTPMPESVPDPEPVKEQKPKRRVKK